MSSISTTITGTARFLDPGSEEERWCKEKHLENNTFESEAPAEPVVSGAAQPEWDRPATEASVGDGVRVVTVRVKEGRIADWKGGVRDWTLSSGEEEREVGGEEVLTNGHP